MKRFHLAAAALALACTPSAAFACSAPPSEQSNLGLVADAETIVMAQVVGGTAATGDPDGWSVVVRPLEAVKGDMPQGDITLRGLGLATVRGGTELSNPFEFQQAHPNAYAGACNRYLFPLGTTALFFLRIDQEGQWAAAADGAFTRWAEDVPDAQAPWVQLVRLYTIAAGLPEADRAPFLEDEREALMARTGEPVAQLMADDIYRQVAGPREPEGRGFEDAFRDPADESAVEAVLRAMRQSALEAGN